MKTNTSPSRLAATFAAFAAALSAPCAFSADYARSFDITFPGYTGSETLTNFPVLVRLSAAHNEFKYAKCREANGGDVRFFDADGVTVLPSEVDTWDPNGVSLVWVRVPRLTATTNIICRYGSFHPDPVTPSDVWSEGYAGVWHLNETSSPLPSATAGGLSFRRSTDFTSLVALGQEGVAGGAAAFDIVTEGTDAHKGSLQISDSQLTLAGMDRMTIELWVNQREIANDRRLLYSKTGSDRAYDFRLGYSTQNSQSYFGCTFGTTSATEEVAQVDITPTFYFSEAAIGVWRHIALVYDSVDLKKVSAYVNGTLANSRDATEGYVILPNVTDIKLGNLGGPQAFPGKVDEFRISNVARSRDWTKATHDTIASDDFAAYFIPNDWGNYARRFTISFPSYTGETLTDFPVLVKLSEAGIDGFLYSDFVRADGGDLRFADAAGNLLDSELDPWDENGVSAVWVKVPSLNASTVLTCYYGFALAPDVNSKAVWSNGYLGVWHLGESARPLKDSGANGLDFTASTSFANRKKASKLGEYDSSNSYGISGGAVGNAVAFDTSVNEKKGGLIAPDDAAVVGGLDTVTFEIWAKCESFPSSTQFLFSKRRASGVSPKYAPFKAQYGVSSGISVMFGYIGLDDSEAEGNNGVATANATVNTGNATLAASLAGKWNYHAYEYNSACSYNTNYLNGVYANRRSETRHYTMLPGSVEGEDAYAICLANDAQANSTSLFNGALDEFRISNVVRSPSWVNATYRTIADHDAFTSYSNVKDNNPNLTTVIFYR